MRCWRLVSATASAEGLRACVGFNPRLGGLLNPLASWVLNTLVVTIRPRWPKVVLVEEILVMLKLTSG